MVEYTHKSPYAIRQLMVQYKWRCYGLSCKYGSTAPTLWCINKTDAKQVVTIIVFIPTKQHSTQTLHVAPLTLNV